ncbi:MAG: hypothetical protein WCJ33_08995 [Pseudomonadota bacterium]
MKKILSIMAVCAVFALASCNNASETAHESTDSTATKVEAAVDSTTAPAADSTKAPADSTASKM